jgi:CheY-like chemotaxis protein
LRTSKVEKIEVKSEDKLRRDIQTLKGSKILLAEDNETNQEIILGLLQSSGIKISIASNGQEAVDKFKDVGGYELILMDIQMPILDGYGATKLIREIDKDIPIIALTANAMKEDQERTKQAGMNAHLNKPIDVEKLYETLLKYISKKTDEIIVDETLSQDDTELPDFNYIDKEYALKLVMGNKKIFLNTLKGLLKYKNINLNSIEDKDEFKRLTHTIKGLSASCGAMELNNIAKELDQTQDKNLIPQFEQEFKKVIDEIEALDIFKENITEKKIITPEKKDELFSKLKDAVKTKRPKNCTPILEEIEQYDLEDKDQDIFNNISNLIHKFKFKEALELL